MSIKAKIYICSEEAFESDNYQACSSILEMCLVKVEIIKDRDTACRLGRGKVNPADGFVIEFPPIHNAHDAIVITNWLKLVKHLEYAAIIPCIY